MLEVKFYDGVEDELLKFAVIISKSNGKWVFCKHKERETYEVPGGHREPHETIFETARRELFEETGLTGNLDTAATAVIEYPISPIARKQVVFFLGEVSGAPKVRAGEIEGFKWVKAGELKDYLFPDTVTALQNLLNT